jgi:uncharacterized membrane protein YedE/YeeE
MFMNNFTPVSSSVGGLLIGVASALMLLLKGRIAGISGMVGGLLHPSKGDASWRALFLIGMMAAPIGYLLIFGRLPSFPSTASPRILVLAGLLVGFGSRLGSGCTSGHGVCGLGRRSRRSVAYTITFLVSGALTVFVLRHLLGVSP